MQSPSFACLKCLYSEILSSVLACDFHRSSSRATKVNTLWVTNRRAQHHTARDGIDASVGYHWLRKRGGEGVGTLDSFPPLTDAIPLITLNLSSIPDSPPPPLIPAATPVTFDLSLPPLIAAMVRDTTAPPLQTPASHGPRGTAYPSARRADAAMGRQCSEMEMVLPTGFRVQGWLQWGASAPKWKRS